jgi:hypothetical protein
MRDFADVSDFKSTVFFILLMGVITPFLYIKFPKYFFFFKILLQEKKLQIFNFFK